MTDTIDYKDRMQAAMNALMQVAMKNMVKDVLGDVAENGLPGAHHFFITFKTSHPGVDLADWLKDKFPDEMTIVMQDWFDNLAIMDDRFTVTLNFNNTILINFLKVRRYLYFNMLFFSKLTYSIMNITHTSKLK